VAYLRDEPGAELVADAIAGGVAISAVTLAEVLSRAADRGADPAGLAGDLADRGLLGGAIEVQAFTLEDAVEVARLRRLTRAGGLSPGDRACLALARRRGARAVTADTAWAEVDAGVELVWVR
jgi:PIN domain nuclease of toxin-antitoxin system